MVATRSILAVPHSFPSVIRTPLGSKRPCDVVNFGTNGVRVLLVDPLLWRVCVPSLAFDVSTLLSMESARLGVECLLRTAVALATGDGNWTHHVRRSLGPEPPSIALLPSMMYSWTMKKSPVDAAARPILSELKRYLFAASQKSVS